MNAKELIEAAERMNEEWNINRIASEDLQAVVNHILSTVRPDDDEPVTRERLEADGWFRRSIRHRHWESQISVIEQHPEFFAEFETGQQICRLKNMGHLRRLVAALGE